MTFLKDITTKPWERKGVIGGMRPTGAFDVAAEKVALSFFLIVATVLFGLFTVGYFVRMELPDWEPLSDPEQLWLNTGLLVLSSILFQLARNTVKNGGTRRKLLSTFIGAGVFALLFIGGQMLAWNNLHEAGYYLTSNPANSFYYLMTGLHALHLLGGLWVWSRSFIRLLSGARPEDLRLSIELCTLYWHFLLAVWVVLFAILSNT